MTADEQARYDEVVALVAWLRDQLGKERMYSYQLEGGKNETVHLAARGDVVSVETIARHVYRRDEVDEGELVATLAHRLSSREGKPARKGTKSMRTAPTETDYWPRRLLDGYTPRARWHDQPATEKQVQGLERRGYLPPEEITKGQAAFALNRPTPRQMALLSARGLYEDGDEPALTFDEARKMLDDLARREGWGDRR
jgi:hypothetical protein